MRTKTLPHPSMHDPLAAPATLTSAHASPLLPISVIIPTYNYASFLPDAIDSALAQTLAPLEIIVVNDGSTDNTLEVLQRYAGRLSIINQTNAGLAAARNAGIMAAQAPWLAFLDADDIWLPHCLAHLAGMLAALPADFGLAAGMQQLADETGRPLPRKPAFDILPGDREIHWEDLLIKNRFGASSVLVKKQCFLDCGLFDASLRSSEDRDMWLRIAARWRIFLSVTPVTKVRRHAHSMSRDPERMQTAMQTVLNRAFQQRPTGRALRRRAEAFLNYELAWMYADAGKCWPAVKALGRSWRQWPWFCHPAPLNEPIGFRLRALRHFILGRRSWIS